jgi:hypothetical protein
MAPPWRPWTPSCCAPKPKPLPSTPATVQNAPRLGMGLEELSLPEIPLQTQGWEADDRLSEDSFVGKS